MDAYKSAVNADKEYSQAHYHLAMLYFVDGNYEQARKHAENAKKDFPQTQKLLSLIDQETGDSKG